MFIPRNYTWPQFTFQIFRKEIMHQIRRITFWSSFSQEFTRDRFQCVSNAKMEEAVDAIPLMTWYELHLQPKPLQWSSRNWVRSRLSSVVRPIRLFIVPSFCFGARNSWSNQVDDADKCNRHHFRETPTWSWGNVGSWLKLDLHSLKGRRLNQLTSCNRKAAVTQPPSWRERNSSAQWRATSHSNAPWRSWTRTMAIPLWSRRSPRGCHSVFAAQI